MTIELTQLFAWHELPPEHWLRPVKEVMSAQALAEIVIPINERAIRAGVRRQGMLLERVGDGRYRLWNIREQISGRDDPVPVDLTAGEEYVDSLAGIAHFLSELTRTTGSPRK
jgi:hypothetical protein